MLELNKIAVTTQEIETIYNSDEKWFNVLFYGDEYGYCIIYHQIDEDNSELVFACGDEDREEYPDGENPLFIMSYTYEMYMPDALGDIITTALEFLERCDNYLSKNGKPSDTIYF